MQTSLYKRLLKSVYLDTFLYGFFLKSILKISLLCFCFDIHFKNKSSSTTWFKHETIIRAGIIFKKVRHNFKAVRDLLLTKNRNMSRYQITNLLKI